MMRAVGLLIVLCLLLFAQQSFVLRANPIGPSVPENPDRNQPIITIVNLKNDSTLNVTSLTFSFTVQKPSSWFNNYPIHGDLISISYILDANLTEIASKGLDKSHYSQDPLTYTITIPELSDGNHSLEVYVRSVSYYLDPNRPAENSTYGWWMYPPANHFMDTYSRIYFAVDTTPTLSTPTPTPIVPEFPIATSLIVVLAVASLLLIIGKQRQQSTITT